MCFAWLYGNSIMLLCEPLEATLLNAAIYPTYKKDYTSPCNTTSD